MSVCIAVYISAPASAGIIVNSGLELCGGAEEITMKVGEKRFLSARHSVWKYPVLKGLRYASDHPSVAYADRHGWIHASLPGKAVISVWNNSGDNGTLFVTVSGSKKVPRWLLLVLIWSMGAFLFVFLQKKLRCF